MKFTKPLLTFEQQADLLLQRGMVADRALLIERLSSVSYYRLSGYWHHRKRPDDSFVPGTEFGIIWEQYVFDRQLRLLVMDAVERVEVAVRTQLSYHHGITHGPFGYADDATSLPKLNSDQRRELLTRIQDEVTRSREPFVAHFFKKYGMDHQDLPAWIATEVMSFGCVLKLLRASSMQVKKAVAQPFGVAYEVLDSWLWMFNEVRNICAHHGRLWNRELGNKPMIPKQKHHPDWHMPIPIRNNRIFAVLTVSSYCLLRVAPQSAWPKRLRTLIDGHMKVPRRNMGFPDDWLQSPLWAEARR